MAEPEFRLATPEDFLTLCVSLADAFADDPVVSPFFGGDAVTRKERAKRLESMFMNMVKMQNSVITCSNDLKAGAVWFPPGVSANPTGCGMVAMGCRFFLPIFCSIKTMCGPSCRIISLKGETTKVLEAMHPDPDEHPHWHLQFLGVHSSMQGKGYGTKLQKHFFELLEKNVTTSELHSTACTNVYLEAAYKANAMYYIKVGYKMIGAAAAKDGKPVQVDPDTVEGNYLPNGKGVGYGMWYGSDCPDFKLKK